MKAADSAVRSHFTVSFDFVLIWKMSFKRDLICYLKTFSLYFYHTILIANFIFGLTTDYLITLRANHILFDFFWLNSKIIHSEG